MHKDGKRQQIFARVSVSGVSVSETLPYNAPCNVPPAPLLALLTAPTPPDHLPLARANYQLPSRPTNRRQHGRVRIGLTAADLKHLRRKIVSRSRWPGTQQCESGNSAITAQTQSPNNKHGFGRCPPKAQLWDLGAWETTIPSPENECLSESAPPNQQDGCRSFPPRSRC